MKWPVYGGISSFTAGTDNDDVITTSMRAVCVKSLAVARSRVFDVTGHLMSQPCRADAPCLTCFQVQCFDTDLATRLTGDEDEVEHARAILYDACLMICDRAYAECVTAQAQLDWRLRGRLPEHEDIWPDGLVLRSGDLTVSFT